MRNISYRLIIKRLFLEIKFDIIVNLYEEFVEYSLMNIQILI